ncbi:MAG: hypothetical protein M1324_01225 [Patescibacteria group bacterium]|nr:hypothetical protein [Patescibacteria group bacterium]
MKIFFVHYSDELRNSFGNRKEGWSVFYYHVDEYFNHLKRDKVDCWKYLYFFIEEDNKVTFRNNWLNGFRNGTKPEPTMLAAHELFRPKVIIKTNSEEFEMIYPFKRKFQIKENGQWRKYDKIPEILEALPDIEECLPFKESLKEQ